MMPNPIKQMLVTEKAVIANGVGKYVFLVDSFATKNEIKKAVKELYKVDAIKVTTLRQNHVKKTYKGKITFKQAPKKAVVTLKEGQKIEIS